MTVKELLENKMFSAVVLPEPDRVIEGVYIGDLLSWVMGNANSGDAWITIMSNVNILAVATLTDCACIILSEGVAVDETICNTALEKGINIIVSPASSYEVAVELSRAL